MFTLHDARNERVAADLAMQAREHKAELRYLRACRRVAQRNGWIDMVARYDARIRRVEGR